MCRYKQAVAYLNKPNVIRIISITLNALITLTILSVPTSLSSLLIFRLV